MLLEDSNIKDKLLKNFIKYFNYFLLLLIVIFFVSCYFFLFKPKQEKINKIENIKIFEGTETYEKNSEYLKRIESLIAKYDSISDEDKRKINLMLPYGLDYPQLFAQVENLVESNGFELNRVALSSLNSKGNKVGEAKQGDFDFIKKVNISITINGVNNFSDYKRMLNMFYSNLLLMDISSISYSSNMCGTYSIDLTTYYLEIEN